MIIRRFAEMKMGENARQICGSSLSLSLLSLPLCCAVRVTIGYNPYVHLIIPDVLVF